MNEKTKKLITDNKEFSTMIATVIGLPDLDDVPHLIGVCAALRYLSGKNHVDGWNLGYQMAQLFLAQWVLAFIEGIDFKKRLISSGEGE